MGAHAETFYGLSGIGDLIVTCASVHSRNRKAGYLIGSAVTLVCNDEGKLLGLPLNRPLWDGADVLAGSGFLAGCDNEGNLTSLPQSAMDFYKEKFRAFIIEI